MSASFTNPFDQSSFTSRRATIPPPANDPEVDVSIFYRHFVPTSSNKSALPIVLLHGHPQTHVIWSSVAPALAASGQWEVVVPDNRGNGESSAPDAKNEEGYSRYSKREMARDVVEVMEQLGHEKFYIVAHDRGARIAHRLALDWPEKVIKMILLDIAPTLDMYEKTDHAFATAYWHWFFLLQPDLAEAFISANPQAYLHALVTRFPRTSPSSTASPSASSSAVETWRTTSYLTNLSRLPTITAMCEDYRASAPSGPDLALDRKDRQEGNKIQCATKVFWGKAGIIQAMYEGGKDLWQACCLQKVEGEQIDCGHYIPEEAPERVLAEIQAFFP
ncbi:related to haloacetate dehalogenase H-1 [Ustilago trichophora]|uniref:Related to haloacetate dehalogenase H-1 n=1 Tax=Ustilago trichophora TaxID=86804 RepID=A0A5C3EAV9_9BASI|nr:related to haloacetate dehalogenase H-1 [Ustilago trichophora]